MIFTYPQDCPHCGNEVPDLTEHLSGHSFRIEKLPCKTQKIGYKTVEEARRAVEDVYKFDGTELRKYRCGECNDYHLTDIHYG